jgi:hypothetical protein
MFVGRFTMILQNARSNQQDANPTVRWIGLLLITFMELCMVAGRSRMRAGHPHAASGQLMLIHTCHAMPMLRCAVALRSRFQNSTVAGWHV